MLYDPKWEQQTKADPFTLESLIAWLEKRPADARYDYWNCKGSCLVGLYARTMGFGWYENSVPSRPEFEFLNGIAFDEPWTFGAALDRARAELKSDRR